ncbi:MAG: NADH-quinone oxidoreductase subunit J [Planctomycetota bacterium]
MNAMTLTFLVLATATIAGSLIVLWSGYVVYSIFGLMLSLLGVAGLYVLLGSDFLAVTQIVVYVGGVLVLYLFGIMLSPPDRRERNVTLIGACSVLGAVAALYLLGSARAMEGRWVLPAEPTAAPEGELIRQVGRAFLDRERYLLAFELASVLLLVALIGAVYIARRRVEAEE